MNKESGVEDHVVRARQKEKVTLNNVSGGQGITVFTTIRQAYVRGYRQGGKGQRARQEGRVPNPSSLILELD